MKHDGNDGGIDFGHEFHGHEHHFKLTRDALEFLAGGKVADEAASIAAYNAHLQKIHAVAEIISRHSDPLDPIVLDRSMFDRAG